MENRDDEMGNKEYQKVEKKQNGLKHEKRL